MAPDLSLLADYKKTINTREVIGKNMDFVNEEQTMELRDGMEDEIVSDGDLNN